MGVVSVFSMAMPYSKPTTTRYCAKCNTLVEYTEQDWKDKGEKGWKQFCKVCGTCVGMRHDLSNLPLKGHADPYAARDSYIRHRFFDKWR